MKTMSEAVDSLLPYRTQSLDDSSVLAETVSLLEAVLKFACQDQQVRAFYRPGLTTWKGESQVQRKALELSFQKSTG